MAEFIAKYAACIESHTNEAVFQARNSQLGNVAMRLEMLKGRLS